MAQTFYWYDYETWGLDPRYTRPSQFAGIRTDLDFSQVGEPMTIYAKPSEDLLPEPDAVMITGITPQKAAEEGITEAEFAKKVHNQLTQPGTISLGYNTLRFDEPFNRYLFWRNFYDPYAHGWKDNCSAWDIIDMVRLTRALRPDGINWPEDNGKPTNRLEKLSVANNIEHADAHDALSDVRATIAIAKLIKTNQPKLFDYVFNHRDKKSVSTILDPKNLTPVVHASDKFGSDVLGTAVVVPVATIEDGRKILVFDLKTDPASVLDREVQEIADNLFTPKSLLAADIERIGVKGVKLNGSPVIAPLGTVNEKAAERIKYEPHKAKKYLETIQRHADEMIAKLTAAFSLESNQNPVTTSPQLLFVDAEAKLYDGFLSDTDRALADKVLNGELDINFKDERMQEMLWRYKARNFADKLTDEERQKWHAYRVERLTKSPMNFEKFALRIQELSAQKDLTSDKKHLLEQLQLYAESIYPYEEF